MTDSMSDIRAELGEQTSHARYLDDDASRLEDISDPATLDDETKRNLSEYASEHPLLAITAVFLAMLATLFLVWVLGRFGLNLLKNTMVQVVLGATILAGTSYLAGRKSQLSAFTDLDWLVLQTSDGMEQYLGHYYRDEYSDPIFVPTRGFSRFGTQSAPYTVDQFAPSLARKLDNIQGRSGDEPAKIRLLPKFAQVSPTDYGMVAGQLADDYELDPFGDNSNLQTTVPETADEGALTDMEQDLRSAQKELRYREDLLNDMEQRVRDLRARVRDGRGEAIDEFVDRVHKMGAALDGRRRTHDQDNGSGVTPRPDRDATTQRLADIEEDLKDDDD